MPDQIVGQAWQDVNGDGNLNAGEAPAAGVEVLLSIDANGDGLCDALEDAVVATSMTDELGRYEFSTLDIGAYCVEIGPGQTSAAGAAGVALDGTSGAEVEIPLQ